MRYALEINFDGTAYKGWQRQKNAITIQEILEDKLSLIVGERCIVTGCGRTDTGVHAKNFILHVDIGNPLRLQHNFIYRLNSVLPPDISATRLFEVPDDFNARFDAQYRTYEYKVHFKKDPFIRRYSYQYPYPFNLGLLNEGAAVIKQYTDFGSFCKSKSQNKTNICKIMECRWELKENEATFVIRADRFLRNMVRAIVGTLFEINEGKTAMKDLQQIIVSGDRSNAGRSAPAHGLTLVEIKYDQSDWREINDK